MTEQYIKVEVPNGEIWQFPSDMPEEEINKVIADSFPPEPEEKGWLGIGKDIYKSGKNFLPEFWKALKQLPSEVSIGLTIGWPSKRDAIEAANWRLTPDRKSVV